MLNQHRRTIHAKNDTFTEKEFLLRELDLELKKTYNLGVDCLRDIQSYGTCLVATTNPLDIIGEISNLPKCSVIIFLLGNETYEPEIFNSLNNCGVIKWVFIYNLPTKIHLVTSVYSFVGDMIDCGAKNLFGAESAFRDYIISNTLKRKFHKTLINYPHSRFPQGYSNNFAHQLQNLNIIDSKESIYESRKLFEIRASKKKVIFLNFIGQYTNRRRNNTIKMAMKLPNTIIRITEGFSGINYTDNYYVETQINSRFCLVPPGFFNNSNHRYTESLILGALPLILAHNSIDPSLNQNWTNKLNIFKSHSFKYIFKYALKISEMRRMQIIISELNNERVELKKVKEILEELILK